MAERTHPLDMLFGVGLAVLLCALLLPLAFLAGRNHGVVPIDGAAEFRNGAVAMCLLFADSAEVSTSEALPVCQQYAADLESAR